MQRQRSAVVATAARMALTSRHVPPAVRILKARTFSTAVGERKRQNECCWFAERGREAGGKGRDKEQFVFTSRGLERPAKRYAPRQGYSSSSSRARSAAA